tara:strand:- start:2548 stop:2835 length:288 start_codon:yes stop_codon:yes gene_type:complete
MEKLKISERTDSNKGFNFFTNHSFFMDKKEVVFEFDDYGVAFRVAGIDDTETINIHKNGVNGHHTFQVYNKDIFKGDLIFNHESSDEDIIYFDYQ